MILVCGEALIDLYVGAEEEASTGLPAMGLPGGSPFNVAVGLARLGAGAGFFGGLSQDSLGEFLAGRLKQEGVDTDYAPRSAHPTPLVVVSTDAEGQPSYTIHGAGCAERELRPSDLPPSLDPRVEALAFGSYTLAVEPVGSTFLELAEREAGRRVISVDPNLRPAIVGDLAGWRMRFHRFVQLANILKVSEEDLFAAYGADAEPDAWAARWLAEGVSLVVVTHGGNGATAYHANGKVHRPALAVKVTDTVGAGDTFHAALLARLKVLGRLSPAALVALDRDTISNLLDFAITAAGITCTRRGADLPDLATVETLLARVSAGSDEIYFPGLSFQAEPSKRID